MCMARVNVYLPDEMAEAIRPLGWNLSNVLQAAVRERLDTHRIAAWLRELGPPADTKGVHQATLAALEGTDPVPAGG
jgi:post-segregation antitoxin (ccd killing protein)